MKKRIQRGIAVAAVAGLALTACAQDTNIDQSQYPSILVQPDDQCVAIGSPVTFSVVATNVDTYQWYKNNAAMDGETNSSVTISSAGTNDVAYYGAAVIKGSEAVPTRLAGLNVYATAGGTTTTSITSTSKKGSTKLVSSSTVMSSGDVTGIVLYGIPLTSNGTNTCSGAYSGYVNYIKTPSQGWGYYTDTNTTFHAATDNNRTDTVVSYFGYSGDGNCNPTSVTVPDPTVSIKYRFTIYFPRGSQVPTNSYPITLVGFLP